MPALVISVTTTLVIISKRTSITFLLSLPATMILSDKYPAYKRLAIAVQGNLKEEKNYFSGVNI
jgi:hypothetical protein